MGKPWDNDIMCETNEGFKKAGSCAYDEWCVGPNNETDASHLIEKLCAKGNVR